MQEVIKIGCTIEKTNPYDKSKMQSKFIRLSEIGLNVAHTITTHEPNIYVQHSNMIIEIRKVDKMYAENTMRKSRAEQSRAEQPSCRIIGQMDNSIDHTFESANRVYDDMGIAPTINTCGGGGLQPKVIEVKKMDKVNAIGNLYPENPHQNGNVYDTNGVANTIMSGTHGYGIGFLCEQQIVAMRGRDKDNPSDRTAGNKNLEQRLEPNSQGISNTITSVQKDNLVLEKKSIKIRQATKDGFIDCEVPGIADLNYPSSQTRRGRVIEGGRISPTLTTENIPSVIELGNPDFYNFLYEIDGEIYLIRIRKLIPRECFKLMDVDEKYLDRMLSAESNTNLYKAAGNSIVVNCLVAILGQFFEGKENVYKEINKCD